MLATFILTRAFAISALLVGALPSAYAAPVDSRALEGRNCRLMGCMFVEPSAAVSQTAAAVPTAAVASAAPPIESTTPSIASAIIEVIDLISELEGATTESNDDDSTVTEPEDIVELAIPEVESPDELSDEGIRRAVYYSEPFLS